MRSLVLLVWLGMGLAGCGGGGGTETPPTELIVVVDTDLSVPSEVDAVTLAITGSDDVRRDVDFSLTRVAVPATLVLHPAGQRLGPVRIEAIGKRAGAEVVWARMETSFLRGERRVVHLVLWRMCRGDDICGAGGSCGRDGSCRPVGVSPEDLPVWTGSPPGIHGSPMDGGMPEDGGGGPVDAGDVDVGCPAPMRTCSGGAERILCEGVEVSSTPCDLGCSITEPNRCARLVSSFVSGDLFARAAAPLSLPAAIDTTACTGGTPQPQAGGGPEACVMVGTTVTAAGSIAVTGMRPLVILATGDVTLGGTIDVSADWNEGGPGAGAGGADSTAGTGTLPGGAFGAPEAGGGGGYCGAGGAAGEFEAGVGSAAGGGMIDGASFPPLRGGSGGGGGGDAWGGGGGGAIAIASRGTIRVSGTILAGGGAGEFGSNGPDGGGGAGGGSGGMIVLEAMTIEIMASAILGAPGGGGGGGGVNYPAADASDGTPGAVAAAGRMARAAGGEGGGGGSGGRGGTSGGGAMVAGETGGRPDDFTSEAPGGGGGGAGCIFLKDPRGTPDAGAAFVTPNASPALRRSVAAHD